MNLSTSVNNESKPEPANTETSVAQATVQPQTQPVQETSVPQEVAQTFQTVMSQLVSEAQANSQPEIVTNQEAIIIVPEEKVEEKAEEVVRAKSPEAMPVANNSNDVAESKGEAKSQVPATVPLTRSRYTTFTSPYLQGQAQEFKEPAPEQTAGTEAKSNTSCCSII